jgi:hypothetical protein
VRDSSFIDSQTTKLLKEIEAVVTPKLWNIRNGTATEMEKRVVSECLGFRSLILFSCLGIRKIKRLWEKSNLRYM